MSTEIQWYLGKVIPKGSKNFVIFTETISKNLENFKSFDLGRKQKSGHYCLIEMLSFLPPHSVKKKKKKKKSDQLCERTYGTWNRLRLSNVSSRSKTLITVLLLEDTLEVNIKTSTNSGDLLKAFRRILTLQGPGPCSSQRTTLLSRQSSSGLCPHQSLGKKEEILHRRDSERRVSPNYKYI